MPKDAAIWAGQSAPILHGDCKHRVKKFGFSACRQQEFGLKVINLAVKRNISGSSCLPICRAQAASNIPFPAILPDSFQK